MPGEWGSGHDSIENYEGIIKPHTTRVSELPLQTAVHMWDSILFLVVSQHKRSAVLKVACKLPALLFSATRI